MLRLRQQRGQRQVQQRRRQRAQVLLQERLQPERGLQRAQERQRVLLPLFCHMRSGQQQPEYQPKERS